ncbi:MAG: glycosyltransferase family 2 protein [Candidatus Omnitrophica bacterium]|nr:glycosyltransferase family 2 protein [Candidatus Omnitrophota bacterium]
MPLLSIIVPVYNEANTIRQILEKIETIDIDKEIIVVDDGSTDDSRMILRQLKYDHLKVIHHSSNRGKGSAVRTGLSQASAEYVIIQDADLEYDPRDYLGLLAKMKESNADIVLGARFTKGYHGSLIPRLGNRFLTGLLNFLFHLKLNDCFTCYKLFRRETISSLNLQAIGFEIEIEIIAKASKRKLRIAEVPISYFPRSYNEGKKIRWKDGVWAILSMVRFRFS